MEIFIVQEVTGSCCVIANESSETYTPFPQNMQPAGFSFQHLSLQAFDVHITNILPSLLCTFTISFHLNLPSPAS